VVIVRQLTWPVGVAQARQAISCAFSISRARTPCQVDYADMIDARAFGAISPWRSFVLRSFGTDAVNSCSSP